MNSSKPLDSHSAIKQWLSKYGDDMYSWAFYKTSSKETAEDLVQDTMVSAFKSYEKYKQGSNPKTWLYTILNNKIIDYYRASNTQKSVNQTSLQGSYADDDNFDSNGSWNTVQKPLWANTEEHLLDNPLFLKALSECLDNLPSNWKGVVVGKYFDHKKGSQICKDLGISSSNLWQIAHRAKQQLRTCLNQKWKDN